MNAEILVFILYFIAIFAVSLVFFFNGSNKSGEDYFLGGRTMGPWVTAMSAQASDMSGWLLMGLPGSVIAFGFGQMWIGIGLILGTAANWILCAKRLRRFSKAADDAITLPQYLANRFMSKSKTLQIICAVIFLVFFTVYVASAFVSGATVFTQLFEGLSERTAMIVFAVLIVAYTFLGGFKAVCWTDFFQGMLMLIALLALPIVIVATQNLDTSLLQNVYSYVDASGETVECVFGTGLFDASWKEIVSGLAWGLGYCGMPHILVRFMAVKNEKELNKSKGVAIVWVFLSLILAWVIGIVGRAYLMPEVLSGGEEEKVFINMIIKVFTTDMKAPIIAGLFLCGVLAAIMSTADSQLLVSASSVAEDIVKGIVKKDAKEETIFKISKITVVVIAILAYLIALDPSSSIMGLVSNAWAGLGAAFGPTVLLSLYWKRTNFQGAVAGIASGALTVILWDYIPLVGGQTLGSVTGLYSLAVGFVISLVAIVIVSLVTPAPTAEMIEEFDDVSLGRINFDEE